MELSTTDKAIDTKNYTFDFGKYKGMTYDDVFVLDPKYIMWCYNDVEWFKLNRDDYYRLVWEIDRLYPPTSESTRPYECEDFGYYTDWGLGPNHILGDS